MKKILAILTIFLSFGVTAAAQFNIKVPKLPDGKKSGGGQAVTTNTNPTTNTTTNTSGNSFKRTLPATTILRPSLTVYAELDRRFWKQPETDNFWSWMPKVKFSMTGPIADASFVTIEFTKPDGKPWFSWDSAPFSVADGRTYEIESEAVPRSQDQRTTIETGTFGFKVILKNNLNGTAQEMYRGTFKVNKKFAGTSNPNFKNQYAFYVEQDWALPFGYLSFDTKQDENAPKLDLGLWFRGDFDYERLTAYLFYNGKEISNTKTSNKGRGNNVKSLITQGDDNKEFYWAFWNFTFYNVRAAKANAYPDAFVLSSNPGNYEIKVVLDDELIRTASFTVGSDAKIVETDAAAKNNFSSAATLIPVKVIPAKEGALNLNSWKTDAFYGNPLTGFSVQ